MTLTPRGVILATEMAGITHLKTVPVAEQAPRPAAAARHLLTHWPVREEMQTSVDDLRRGAFALRRRNGALDLLLPFSQPEQIIADGTRTDRHAAQMETRRRALLMARRLPFHACRYD